MKKSPESKPRFRDMDQNTALVIAGDWVEWGGFDLRFLCPLMIATVHWIFYALRD